MKKIQRENVALRIYPNMLKSILKLPLEEQDAAIAALVRKGFDLPMQPLTLMQDLATAAVLPMMELKGLQGAPLGNKNAIKNNIENNIENKDSIIENNIVSQRQTIKKQSLTKAEAKAQAEAKAYTQSSLRSDCLSPAPPEDIVAWWNELAEKYALSKVSQLTKERRGKLDERAKEAGGVDGFKALVAKALSESAFLRGDNKQGWRSDFDFFLQKSSFVRAAEGAYARGSPPGAASEHYRFLQEKYGKEEFPDADRKAV